MLPVLSVYKTALEDNSIIIQLNSVIIQFNNSVNTAKVVSYETKISYTKDSSVIIQLNSVQVLFSSDSISAIKSIILLNINCI